MDGLGAVLGAVRVDRDQQQDVPGLQTVEIPQLEDACGTR